MTRREQLLEDYEEALFALLMYEVAEEEGKKLLEENERLKKDPSAAIPEDVDRRCRRTIKKAFAKEHRGEVARVSYRVLNKVAMIAMVAMLLFATAFAAVPAVRVRTLNLLIEVTDVATRLTLSGETNSGTGTAVVPGTSSETLRGYSLPEIPEGFTVSHEGSDSYSAWIRYANKEGQIIHFDVTQADENMTYNVDTEDAQNVEMILIHGYDGLLIEKGERVDIVWGDTDQGNFVTVCCTGIDRTTVENYAAAMIFVGNS